MKVAILDDYQQVALSMAGWKEGLPGAEVVAFGEHLEMGDALVERLRPFEVVVAMRERTPFPRTLIEALPALRLLVTTGMRNASIDLQAAAGAGVTVCGTGGLPWPTAELTWGLILSLARQIPVEDASVRSGGWQRSVGVDLHGKTLGVVGLGRLGAQVAAVGRAFGMGVVAWSPHLTSERAASHQALLVTKEALLARSDVVTIHMVLSEETRGLVGERELRSMRPSAYLVNTSRGPLVEEAALLRALHEGWIAGAALDVFDTEPLPPGHPLIQSPRTVLTPHLGYVTADTYRVFYGEALEDIQAFVAGDPVRVVSA